MCEIGEYNVIDESFKHGRNIKIGSFCFIGKDVIVGDNVTIGNHCTILKDVIVGNNCKIGNRCLLKSGTRFANNVVFADLCSTTGICYLGNNVSVRTASCISKSVIVEDWAFIGAGIMSSHTRFPAHGRTNVTKDMGKQYITRIGYGSLIGSRVNLGAGIEIVDFTIVGYRALVVKSISEAGIYVGSPAKKIAELPKGWKLPKPKNYEPHTFSKEMLKKYLPHYEG